MPCQNKFKEICNHLMIKHNWVNIKMLHIKRLKQLNMEDQIQFIKIIIQINNNMKMKMKKNIESYYINFFLYILFLAHL